MKSFFFFYAVLISPALPLIVYDSSGTLFSANGCHVAVVGAGAAGSSAAWHLYHEVPHCKITIFEKESRVGGRARTTEISGHTVEIGASLFVTANRYMYNFAKIFDLPFDSKASDTSETMGFWNGSEFTFIQHNDSSGWFNFAKFVYRYGWSYLKLKSFTKTLLSSWERIYDEYSWRTVAEIYDRIGMGSFLSQTGTALAESRQISEKLINELLAVLTRVNYAQDPDVIHAWGALVSFVPSIQGNYAIKGGNHQVFEKLIEDSGARMRLETPVEWIGTGGSEKRFKIKPVDADVEEFDAVIIAAPPKYSQFEVYIGDTPMEFSDVYVKLHVTVVAADRINSAYFGKSEQEMPQSVYTVKGSTAPFISLSIISQATDDNPKSIFKIFSRREVSQELLGHLLVGSDEVQRYVFHPYPELPPTDSFPDIVIQDGLFYANAFESSISTMETEMIAGRNTARLATEFLQVDSSF